MRVWTGLMGMGNIAPFGGSGEIYYDNSKGYYVNPTTGQSYATVNLATEADNAAILRQAGVDLTRTDDLATSYQSTPAGTVSFQTLTTPSAQQLAQLVGGQVVYQPQNSAFGYSGNTTPQILINGTAYDATELSRMLQSYGASAFMDMIDVYRSDRYENGSPSFTYQSTPGWSATSTAPAAYTPPPAVTTSQPVQTLSIPAQVPSPRLNTTPATIPVQGAPAATNANLTPASVVNPSTNPPAQFNTAGLLDQLTGNPLMLGALALGAILILRR